MELLALVGIAALLLWSYGTFKSLFELCWGLWKERTGDVVDYVRRYGKWAVITGGSEGIGRHYATFFASKGLNIVIIAKADEKLKQTSKDIEEKYGVQVRPMPLDFSNGFRLYKELQDILAGLEIGVLVNNVGMVNDAAYFDTIAIENYECLINVNINAAVVMSRIVLPQMKERGRGLVINIASAFGIQPVPVAAMYSASKAFMLSFSQSLQEELRPFGVECQTVTPFFVRTSLVEEVARTTALGYICVNVDSFGRFLAMTIGKTSLTTGHWIHALMVTCCKLIPTHMMCRVYHYLMKAIAPQIK